MGMKKVVLGLLAVWGGWQAYRWFDGSRAVSACEGFAEAWAREDRTAAAKYGDSEAVRRAFEETPLRGTPGGAAMEAFRGTRYSVESRTRSAGGSVELVVRQTIFFDPPGVTTAIGGRMFAHFRHAATLRKTESGWRVAAFQPAYLDMGDLRQKAR